MVNIGHKIPKPPGLPLRRDLTLAYRLALGVALLMIVASVAGLLLGYFGGLYGDDPTRALGVGEVGLREKPVVTRWSRVLIDQA